MPSSDFMESFAKHVDSTPQADALMWRSRMVSYSQLNQLIGDAEKYVSTLPMGTVCVPGLKTPQTLALLMGCWRTGRPTLVCSSELGEHAMRELASRARCVRILWTKQNDDLEFDCRAHAVEPTAVEYAERHRRSRLWLTTSGSTGIPKIVPLSPEGVTAFFGWAGSAFDIASDSRLLSYAPLHFDLSLLDIWSALYAGATTVLVESGDAMRGKYLCDLLAESRVTTVQGVPLFFRLVLDAAGSSRFSDVEHVMTTGEAMPAGLLRRLPELFPAAQAHNVYGCTETNDSIAHRIESFDVPDDYVLPIGKALPGVSAHVVDDEDRVVTGAGTGRLVVSTPFQADGYLDPELTAERFIADPDGADNRTYYDTGDIVSRDTNGVMRMLGRNDLFVKVRGVRTNIGEIEHVLTGHVGVREAAVVTIPDDWSGHRLHGVVFAVPGSERSQLTSLKLRQFCAQRLPRTAIPSSFEIRERALPKTSTGKVDRSALTK